MDLPSEETLVFTTNDEDKTPRYIEILRITADGDIYLRGVKIGHDDELGTVLAGRLYGQT